jgi:hypothetical protein
MNAAPESVPDNLMASLLPALSDFPVLRLPENSREEEKALVSGPVFYLLEKLDRVFFHFKELSASVVFS